MVSMAGHEAWRKLRSAVLELRARRLQVKLLRVADPRSGERPRVGRTSAWLKHPTFNNEHPMKTRTGKIARLPRLIRNELNQRLDNGEEGKKLVRWLNRLPEVRQVMAEYFEGKPVSEQNLSEWKAGGFAEWAGRQEFLEQARELAEEAEDLRSVAGKGQASFSEHLSTVLAMRYAAVLKEWKGEAGEAMTKQLRLLHGLSHDVARLARVGLERQKVELTREKSQAELVDLFTDWVEIPEVREVVCEDYVKLADRKRALCQLYHQPYEEVQSPRSKVQRKSGGRRRNRQGNKRQGNGGQAGRGKLGNKKHSTANIQRPTSNERSNGSTFTSEPMKTRSGRKRWLKEPTRCDVLGRVPYQTEAKKKAAREAAGQKRMDEATARGYIRSHPDWKKAGRGKQPDTDGANPGKSDSIKSANSRGNIGSKPLTPSLSPLGRGEGEEAKGRRNPTQSDPIIPAAMEAEVARLNRGDPPTLRFRLRRTSTGQAGAARGDENEQGNGNHGTDVQGGPDWDPEDELILKEAAKAHERRETARKAEEEKKVEEEYRLWRVDFGFEEPTEEDIALGRTKRKRWNKAETSNIQQPTPNIQ
jgi:hypothetical protein